MRVDVAAKRQQFSGDVAISADYQDGFGTVQLSRLGDLYAEDYLSLNFAVHGGRVGGQRINLAIVGEGGTWSPPIPVTPIPGNWNEYSIPLTDFDNPQYIRGIVFQEAEGSPAGTFYIDDIWLERNLDVEYVWKGPKLSVDLDAEPVPINPHIYGINFADPEFAEEIALPLNRWGGNAVSRYNWQLDVTNRAADWYFWNNPNGTPLDQLPENSSSNEFLRTNQSLGTDSILTVPMLGWTPKNERSCGFPVEQFGKQQYLDPEQRCGNGLRENGEPLVDFDPSLTSLPVDEQWTADWVAHVNEQGFSPFFALDNEPFLWHVTHRDVIQTPLSYDGLLEKTVAYGAAIKAVDPEAQLLGPVLWGWTAYEFSAEDAANGDFDNPPDRLAHDDTPFIEWYLQQMAAYEAENGVRLLDYLDLHYYPQSAEIALFAAGGASTQNRRLRTTRSLWDTAYEDESWIEEPVALIPRMREWVDTHYPGTKLALTEYNWGGLEHINGALTQAEILGIFGRERLDMAALWQPQSADEPWAYAFRLYRNYDGNGSQFGDLSLPALSSDDERMSIFAARRSTDDAITIIVINKTRYGLDTTLTLPETAPFTAVAPFQYSADNLNRIVQLPAVLLENATLTTRFPAESITLLELDPNE